MMSKIKLLLLISVVSMASCGKDDELSNSEKIKAKWSIETMQVNNVAGGVSTTTTYTGLAADYIDFRADNKLYTSVNGTLDTTNYTVTGNQVTVNKNTVGSVAQTYDIRLLTTSQCQLYIKNIGSGTDYSEITANLKK